MSAAAMLWTGGKDSYLAWLAVRDRLSVVCLATFVPDPPRSFLAHPLECMRAQARALGLPHRELAVRAPLERGYEAAIDALAEEGIEVVVTGDMDRIDGHESWILERARDVVRVERPLWGADRFATLRALTTNGVRAVCTLERERSFEDSIVGRELDAALIDELAARHGDGGFDACGENGEYHTCVLDGPGFSRGLRLDGARVEAAGEFRRLVFDRIRSARGPTPRGSDGGPPGE